MVHDGYISVSIMEGQDDYYFCFVVATAVAAVSITSIELPPPQAFLLLHCFYFIRPIPLLLLF